MRFPNLNALWAHALLEGLRRASGLREIIVCPGSRSAPLAVAAAEHPELRVWSVLDERSAAFVALGIGKQSGVPAALVVTSGTAGAHAFPAVLEAEAAGVPLIVLTADRPWELHGWGAQQTMEQIDLFGAHVRHAVSLPTPEARRESVAHLLAQAALSGARARGARPGPVHVNVPFREPLAPVADGVALEALEMLVSGAGGSFHAATARPDPEGLAAVRARIAACARGVIVCGPRDAEDGLAASLARLSADTGYPVFAEASSQVRFGADCISTYDSLLRSERWTAATRPELVLRFGGGITTKRLQAWIDVAPVVLFSEGEHFFDPEHRAVLTLEGDAVAACEALLGARQPLVEWRAGIVTADRRARRELEEAQAEVAELDEPGVAHALGATLPSHAQLFVASSMPIRDVDTFAHRAAPLRVLSNRGVNGIDGLVSSALGAAIAGGRPTVLLTGDVGFLHDLSGWVAAKRSGVPLCVVVVNNDGGGIFSFLPIAQTTPHFEPLFAAPHGLSFEGAASWLGARYCRPATAAAFCREVEASLEGGLTLIEVTTNRAANVARHEVLGARVVRAIEQEGTR